MNRIAASAMILAIAPVFAADDMAGFYQRNADRDVATFEELDLNRDASLTREEVQGMLDFEARFNDMDTNRDGYVTREELQTYVQRNYLSRVASGK